MEHILQDYIMYLQEKNLAQNTIKSYERDLKKYYYFLKEQNIEEFSLTNHTTILSYLLKLQKDSKSSSSISRYIVSIRKFYDYLCKNQFLRQNPMDEISGPKAFKKIPEVLSLEEVNQLMMQPQLDTKKGIRDKAMLEILYATGIRVSELISLDIEDVDLEMEYIRCCNGNKDRTIPMGKHALEALKSYIIHERKDFLKNEEEKSLFLNYSGKRLSRQGFWKIIKGYTKTMNISKSITPHTLRHSFAIHLIDNGADLKSVQEMLGHSALATTQMYIDFKKNKIKDVYLKSHPRA
ncbi:site-specific tyrosine recombinase XerD [Isachenkonia alkalipeptolytica]|uniref:Tyrosine recombinase XerC n=1 Tax=Isachenkonia alkalipeptolytica TaxID=2565777 RepID=A0AA43XKZ8_9CLOT|nr:site-specific tyrosine recombinase XerD [Isachenkonia alkalipeptolytica]NBG88773.1 site-specific tyrosine recombinase XerD [Isachenkonia alkalipeptolytica]